MRQKLIESILEILKLNGFKGYQEDIYDVHSDEAMDKYYTTEGVSVSFNFGRGYVDIVGLTDEEFYELKSNFESLGDYMQDMDDFMQGYWEEQAVQEQIELDMNNSDWCIPDRINDTDTLGDTALERVIESVNNAIKWLDAMYLYKGPNGSKIEDLPELQKAMTPRDWAIYCMLNRLECDLHV